MRGPGEVGREVGQSSQPKYFANPSQICIILESTKFIAVVVAVRQMLPTRNASMFQ
jgi:hypothetical protein